VEKIPIKEEKKDKTETAKPLKEQESLTKTPEKAPESTKKADAAK